MCVHLVIRAFNKIFSEQLVYYIIVCAYLRAYMHVCVHSNISMRKIKRMDFARYSFH